jgi:hypothetical protein
MTPLMCTFYSVLPNVAGIRLQFSMSFFNQDRESQIFINNSFVNLKYEIGN